MAELGNHVFIVGEGHLYIDAGLLLKLGDHIIRGVATSGDQAQIFGQRGAGKTGGGKGCRQQKKARFRVEREGMIITCPYWWQFQKFANHLLSGSYRPCIAVL